MKYIENVMLEYIEYLSGKMNNYDSSFDGYVLLNSAKCEKNTGLYLDQQNKAIRGLLQSGVIESTEDGADQYVKIARKQNHRFDKRHKPRDEAERKFMKLAYHPPTYQHGKTVYDYREEADMKFKDPDWWSR